MFKKWSLFAAIALLALFALAVNVQAATEKYTFNDVEIDENTIIEIEASTKSVKKGDFSTCSYYADDYAEYLGYYEDDTLPGNNAEEVLAFCIDHFDEREHG